MGHPRERIVIVLLMTLLVACSSAEGADDAILLEPEALSGAAATTTTAPATTTTDAAVLGTVVTQPTASVTTTSTTTTTTSTTTTTTIPPLPVIEGRAAPDFAVELADGSTFSLAEQHRPVLLVFWAEWCHTCLKELPYIDQIAADYGDQVTVLTLARDSREDTVAELVSELMPSGRALWALDERLEVSGRYAIPGVPVSVLVLGAVEAERWLGSAGTEAALRAALDECLALMGA